ncbi:MAG: hypothetical protein EXR28_04080 [Betaproteobacteria bacterium]|nr:hypothetical protein [Betaproteobacteria bacterium]
MSRGLSLALMQSMGQTFVIDNRPVADGMIAGEACVRAAPDGYTLCGQDSYSISMNTEATREFINNPAFRDKFITGRAST